MDENAQTHTPLSLYENKRGPSVIYGLDVDVYHADHSLSNSLMKHLGPDSLPVDFQYNSWFNPKGVKPWEDSLAKKFGRAAHMFMLEGETVFHANWGIKKGNKGDSTEAGKIGEGAFEVMQECQAAVLSDPILAQALKGCKTEVSMFAEMPVMPDFQAPMEGNPITMVPVRCRHDIFKPGYSADLKFVDSLDSTTGTGWDIFQYGYDLQAALYLDIMRLCNPEMLHQNFVTIFVEKKAPFKVLYAVYDDTVLERARAEIARRLERFVQWCEKYGKKPEKWPGFPQKIHTVYLDGEGGLNSINLPKRYEDYR